MEMERSFEVVVYGNKKYLPILNTVCPGSSDPPEKMFYIFALENEVYTIY